MGQERNAAAAWVRQVSMKARSAHVWWIGFALFAPSLLIWAYFIVAVAWKFRPTSDLSWHSFTHTYFPLCAAVLGTCVPIVCLQRLRDAPMKLNGGAFAFYITAMPTWGVLDVRNEHYQVGGHDYPNGILADGHRYYWHLYFTWYFMPYRWIHGYKFD
jgi:hypothetical protein